MVSNTKICPIISAGILAGKMAEGDMANHFCEEDRCAWFVERHCALWWIASIPREEMPSQ